jgi:hypothetical protein
MRATVQVLLGCSLVAGGVVGAQARDSSSTLALKLESPRRSTLLRRSPALASRQRDLEGADRDA